MSVFIKRNTEWIQTIPEKNLIFVISPGAGTKINEESYKKIENHFKIIYFGKSGGSYDKYPSNWINNKNVSNKGYHLGRIPELIICGSRGSQVSIGKVWYNTWRGPTININAGCLTTNTIIPYGVDPVFITMSKDYFKTVNTIDKTISLFGKLKENPKQKALFIHLDNEYHMPLFINDLIDLPLNIILYTLKKTEGISHNKHTKVISIN